MKRQRFEEILQEYNFPEDLIVRLWRSVGLLAENEEMIRMACENVKDKIGTLNAIDQILVRKKPGDVVHVKFDYSKINYN